jgi:hypothetical protein
MGDTVRSAQRVAVTLSGRMHFDMAMRDMVYVAQMALATPLRAVEVVDAIRSIKSQKLGAAEWSKIRSEFITYCVKEDARFVRLPSDASYDRQRQLGRELELEWCRSDSVLGE